MSRLTRRLGLVTAVVALGTLTWGAGSALAGTFLVSAHTTFDRTYNWEITKVAHDPSLTLALGESFDETYTVTVKNTGYTDSNWTVADGINYSSDTTFTATNVTAVINPGGIVAPVDCTFFGNYALPFTGKSIICKYGQVALPDGTPRTVTATVTFSDGSSVSQDRLYNFTTDLNPGGPVEFDKCVDASDSFAGLLGTVCVADGEKTFTYHRQIGPYNECGDFTVDNTAWLDIDPTHPASATVHVHVPCAGGCTLTQGYWKTHSQRGPAPYDDNWANLGSLQEDTPFFSSGLTWYQLFWTPPAGGNAYIQLAHQYMAAKLNILNGASTTPAVVAAIAWAESFFPGKTPATTLSKSVKAAAVAAAGTLGSYNEGLIGPGHCDE